MAAMLPWRRNKFVLVEEGEGKGKSLGLGLSYCSLLSNLARSCPDLWPECPLERLGSVFRSKRQKVELNREDPVYTVWYLGNAVTLQAKGEGCTEEAVEKIWAKSEFGGRSAKMKLTLGPQGIRMSPVDKGSRRPSHAYLLRRITYCGADRRRPKVFTWVYRHQVKNKAVVLRCHAVLLSKAEKAHAMARLLYQTSHSAFNEFKRLKRQDDARHLQRQLLGEAIIPLVPLRRLLNCKCPYRPPPDRNRSAPRLSAIQEEEEEEEEKGKQGEGGLAAPTSHSASSAHKVDWIQAKGVFCANAAAVAGTVAARFSVGNTEAARVMVCATSHLTSTSAVASAMAACLSLSTTDSSLAGKTTPGHHAAHKGKERSEVLKLARELRFCTLRGPLPQVDTLSSWEAHNEASCFPC